MFSQFGWLSSNIYVLYVYLTVPIVVLIHWKTNQNRCVLTERTNKMCDISDGYFRDWIELVGIKKQKWYDTFHMSLLFTGWCIALWKIKNIATYFTFTANKYTKRIKKMKKKSISL
jgi:hypothetical protein